MLQSKRVWIVICSIVVALLIMFFALNTWLSHQMNRTGFTSASQRLEIVIGNDVVRTPANFIRFEHQRLANTADQLDLVFLFPEITGYSDAKKAKFNATGNESQLVHITLSKRKLSFDMSSRLQPIYKQLFEGVPSNGPAGLTFQPLRAGSGYDGEVLAIGKNIQNARQSWVARCQKPESNMRPICIRDVFVGREISALYSFPLHMLKDWKAIDRATMKFLKGVIYE